jgi:hypothetical protein
MIAEFLALSFGFAAIPVIVATLSWSIHWRGGEPSMFSPPVLLARFLGYFLVAGLFLAVLGSILPGRPPHAVQFARAEVLWRSIPGERVRSATEYVDARFCRNLATVRPAGVLKSGRIDVTCLAD